MKISYSNGIWRIEKPEEKEDKFTLEFIKILNEVGIKYVLVSGYVSILFGREDKGLKNEEIKLCDTLIEIPAHKKYPSFNLADAVLLVCHVLFMAEKPSGPSITLAPWKEVDGMYIHLEKTLRKLDYGKKGGAHLLRAIMRSFKRLFGRTGLMQKEVNMLRGICTQIEARVK